MNRNLHFVTLLLIGTVNSQIVYDSLLNTQLCPTGGSNPTINSTINMCYNTPGCVMPDCCGLISGTTSNHSMTYRAIESVPNGVASSTITAISLPTNDPLNDINILLPIPITITSPQLLADILNFNPNMCYAGSNLNPDFCPQIQENIYTYYGIGEIPPIIGNTAVFNF